MWKRGILVFLLAMATAALATAESARTSGVAQASGEPTIELSTRDQNSPGVFLGLPDPHRDRPPGGVEIYLFPDNRMILYLRFQMCTQDMFGRDRDCTDPPDFYFEGRLQEVGTVYEGGHSRTLYDIIIEPGTLRTRLVITDQGEYFLIVPLDSEEPQYQRVKLFVSSEQ